MGLGKTVEAIAAMVSLTNTGATHFLVISPASVLENWFREIIRHSKLKATKIYGSHKKEAIEAWKKTGGVAVTNYESTGYFDFNDNFTFSLLVVDEAHYIKNIDANRSQNTRNISKHASRLLFMTGTAIENNVSEMISLISVLRNDIAKEVAPLAYFSTSNQFREKIAPVYLRRKRDDVLTELPDKIEKQEICTLNDEEEKIYEKSLFFDNHQQVRRLSFNIDNLDNSSKTIRIKEIIDESINDNRKVLIFSFFLDTLQKLYCYFRNISTTPITGALNSNERQKIIDDFSDDDNKKVLLAQINSGGTGLNIQVASVVIICEPQFKPSIENQAISRAYRMGQARKVLVYHLICQNTIEEKMVQRLEEKQLAFNVYADKSVAYENTQDINIDETSFKQIINEEIDRIKSKNNSTFDINSDQTTFQKNEVETIPNKSVDNFDYYNQLMKMSYQQVVSSLLKKYGSVDGDYFLDEFCRQKNTNITRGNEGLFIHHIDEDKAIMLSNSNYAINNPFDYQKASRLVYCNLLEHFLLHILIYEEPNPLNANQNELQGLGGAINFLCKTINDCYTDYNFKKEYYKKAKSLIINDFSSYVLMVKRLWNDICENNPNLKRESYINLTTNSNNEIDKRILDAINNS